jgi:DNA-binding transcriptional LysR family regulator
MAHFTIRQLEVFTAAGETLSFARVAERLLLTPSAVSFQIRQIELQAGLALFERIGRRVALTEAGNVLLHYARPVLQSMRDADQAMQALRGAGNGRVTLGLVSTAKYIVPHMIARFRTLFPGVHVSLREGNRAQIRAMLVGGDIDLAVMGRPPEDADVTADQFAPHPSVIVTAPSSPLLERSAIQPETLADEWFIVREQGSGTRLVSDRFFADAGFSPRIAMESSSNEMIKQAVMAGMGLALLSSHTIGLETRLGLIRVLPVAGLPVMRAWFVVQRRTAPLLPDQAALRRFLVEQGGNVIEQLSEGIPTPQKRLARPR